MAGVAVRCKARLKWGLRCGSLSARSGVVLQGKRYSLANSRIMIHQPLGGAQGQAADIEIQANGARRRADMP